MFYGTRVRKKTRKKSKSGRRGKKGVAYTQALKSRWGCLSERQGRGVRKGRMKIYMGV